MQDVEPLSAEQWQAFVETRPALAPDATGQTAAERGAADEDLRPDGSADFGVLAACQDTDKAKEATEIIVTPEGKQVAQPHGVLTLSLPQTLRQIPAAQIRSLRWLDLYDDLQRTVLQRVAAMRTTSQRPALEGRRELPVSGGAWTPFSPGFTVRADNGVYTVDGGVLHGLDAESDG